jgi:formate-dependent nitrite reductase membrane component NrfD
LVHSAFWIWPFNWLTEAKTLCKALRAINATFAFLTIIYTGLLLGSVRAIPLWCSPLLPVIFLVSGLSTGLMATNFSVFVLYKIGPSIASSEVVFVPPTLKFPLLLLEGLLVFFYLNGSNLLEASRASIHKIVKGNLATAFWIGFVFLGLLIPSGASLIESFFSFGGTRHSFALAALTGVPGLVGGYFLRHVIVEGGIKVPFGAQGIVVPPLPEI